MASLTPLMRTNPKSGKTEPYWVIAFREGGKQRREALGFISKTEAQKLLKTRAAELHLGVPSVAVTKPERPPVPTLTTWWGGVEMKPWRPSRMLDWLDAEGSSKSTRDTAHGARVRFLPLLGALRLDEVNEAHRDVFLAAMRRDGLSSRTCIVYLGWLRRSLNIAVADGLMTGAPALRAPADTDKKRSKFLLPDQTAILQAELRRRSEAGFLDRSNAALAIQMQETLLARPGEVCHQRWENLRRDPAWTKGEAAIVGVRLPDESCWVPKKGRERTVAVPPSLMAALRAHWVASGEPKVGWVFPRHGDPRWPVTTYHKALANACVAAGLPKLNPHALRHTGATRLAMAGVERRTVQEIGGWADGSMLDGVYEHTTDARMVEVMARFEVGVAASPGLGE